MHSGNDSSGSKIKLYKSFGSPVKAYVFGHVFTKQKLKRERVSSNMLKNAWEMLKRYRVSIAPNESVNVLIEGQNHTISTDSKGYFILPFTPPKDSQTLEFTVSLSDDPTVNTSGTLEIRDPKEIIISDIDDTILVSHTTSLVRKVYTLLSRNFERRKPFRGVQKFYHQLHSKSPDQLFFYVSSSEWNLYDFIVNFCRHHDFPKGKFLLNDLKIGLGQVIKSGGGTHQHKYEKIRLIREAYKQASLILIGDSGQKDAEIYEKIALETPDRINEIYIRDLHKRKRKNLLKKQKRLAELNIAMYLFN